MEEEKILLLINIKGCWLDKTREIENYHFNGQTWNIKYTNSSTTYPYKPHRINIYGNPQLISFETISLKGTLNRNVKKVLSFRNFSTGEELYKLFYKNGTTDVVSPSEIVFDKHQKANNIISYYKQVIQELPANEEISFLKEFLVSQFNNITSVDYKSVLTLFLEGILDNRNSSRAYFNNNLSNNHFFIAPFKTNQSQMEAVKMVFKNRISIIEGPPGTGKTQTILNIISNAIINGLNVAVVSKTNSATDNVFEKLEENSFSFFAAPLGKSDNVKAFFEQSHTIPPLKKTPVNESELCALYYGLPHFLELENKKKMLENEIFDIKLQQKHFFLDNNHFDFSAYKPIKKSVSSKSVCDCILKYTEKPNLSVFDRIKIRWKFRHQKNILKLPKEDAVTLLYNFFYQAKINEKKKEILAINKEMTGQNYKEKHDRYVRLSSAYFINKLKDKYPAASHNLYNELSYKRNFESFVNEDYPVILSSTTALTSCIKRGFLFDLLIVDEASQVNMDGAILTMAAAKRILVVGDSKQLPQIDDANFKARNDELLKKFNVDPAYSYYGNNILSSFLSVYKDKIKKITLREHYRCNPNIIGFCNKEFYNDELIIHSEDKSKDYSMKIIKTVEGNNARKNPNGRGLYNQREIDEIKALIDKEPLKDLGIITPYSFQSELLKEAFGDTAVCSTIHTVQGRQMENVIFSSVVNDLNDFVDNENLINVAVSRAKEKFILVTSDKVAQSRTGIIADLVKYISYHTEFGVYEQGTITSIYDILYEECANALAEFRRTHPSKEYDTEALTAHLLDEILQDSKYSSVKYTMHVGLKNIIALKPEDLTEEEYSFYKNPLSHTDFLLYNKMNKRAIMAIEVDGVSFHEQNKQQRERDEKKNAIFKKSGIPLLRLKTNGSEERKKITSLLNDCLNIK